jgi:tetratricopeptide (TPR) repeat protein
LTRSARRSIASFAGAAAIGLSGAAARASASGDELVRQARAHEAAHEDDVAVRRYMEALSVDPVNEEAFLGLGALRARLGEAAEAERVYTLALERVPSQHAILEARARARWSLGHHAEAESDLEVFAGAEESVPALRELAGWYAVDGRTPAQLAIWRRLLALAVERGDPATEREARRTVRALVLLVDLADPVSSSPWPDETRRALASMARRGG